MRQIDGPLGGTGGECPSIHAGISLGEHPTLINVLNRSTGNLAVCRSIQRIISSIGGNSALIGGTSILGFSLNRLAVSNVCGICVQLFCLCTGNARREHGNSQQRRKIFPSHLVSLLRFVFFEHIKVPLYAPEKRQSVTLCQITPLRGYNLEWIMERHKLINQHPFTWSTNKNAAHHIWCAAHSSHGNIPEQR